jgi:hypothetical protein
VTVFLIVLGLLFVASVVRMRQRGPAVAYIPRRWSARMNARYRDNGWPEPFDDQGNRRKPDGPWWRR